MKRYIVVFTVLAVIIAGFFVYRAKTQNQNQTVYKTVKAERGSIQITILSTGSVKPVTRVDIKPSIAGRAEQVLVREGDKVRKNQVLVITSTTERAALLDAARARGPEAGKEWEQLYRPVPILSPINGTVILRAIEPGQSFATSDAILAMSDRLSVEALVDETDIAQIKKDQRATLILDAYPNNPIPGKVEKIAYEATTVSNVTTYHVVVIPDETPDFMRSGMTANVTFEISRKDDVVTIPTEAIRRRDGQSVVLQAAVSGDPRDPPREVSLEVGLTDGKKTEVTSGLQAGAEVLITQAKTTAESAGSNPFMPSRMGGKKTGAGSKSGASPRGGGP